jgi:hypothetical protein
MNKKSAPTQEFYVCLLVTLAIFIFFMLSVLAILPTYNQNNSLSLHKIRTIFRISF